VQRSPGAMIAPTTLAAVVERSDACRMFGIGFLFMLAVYALKTIGRL